MLNDLLRSESMAPEVYESAGEPGYVVVCQEVTEPGAEQYLRMRMTYDQAETLFDEMRVLVQHLRRRQEFRNRSSGPA